jgi:parvulin-like peptidyl-prolyl isomerase
VNRNAPIASLSLLLLLVGAGLAAPRTAGAELLNRIVLRVNDRIATLYDYEKRKNELIEDANRRDQDPADRKHVIEHAGELVFKDLFDDLLLESRADQLGVEITDQQVDKAILQMREGSGIKDEQQFAQALEQQGLTEAKLRSQMKTNLRLQEVLGREVTAKVKVDEEDLRKYYRAHPDEFRVPDQVQLREVVVPEDKVPSAAERARVAGEVRRALLAGKPMAEAVEPFHTQGEASAPADLGWVSPGDLDKTLETAVWKLPKGAVSEPVAGRGGVHVLQVVDRREAHLKPFNEVSSAIDAKERQRVYREKVTEYMADLQKQSLVVAQPPPDAADFRKLIPSGDEQKLKTLSASDAATAAAPKPDEGAAAGPGANVPGPSAAPGSAPAPGSPGGLATPKPVDATPPPVIPPPAQSQPVPPPPPTPR